MNAFTTMFRPRPRARYGASGFGSAMQRGQGVAYREGSLGAALSLSNDNLIFLAIGGIMGVVAVKQGWVKKGFLGT